MSGVQVCVCVCVCVYVCVCVCVFVCVCVCVELLSVCDRARRVAPWAPAALTALPQLHSGETDMVAAA